MNKTTVTKLPKSLVEIVVEVPAQDFDIFAAKALGEFVKEAEVPGFRKGAAPAEVVKGKVGPAKIMDRAATLAIEATFPVAITENGLEPLGYPEVNILKLAQGNPFEYKAVIAVYPHADLPDYKQIAGGFKPAAAEVTEEDIKRLKMEKERHLREHLREDVIRAVAEKTAVEVPEILVQRETEKMMHQLKEKTPQVLNMSFEDYLAKLGKTEAELKADMARDNEKKIKNYLVLEEISKREKIEASDDEVAAAIAKSMAEDNASGEPRVAGQKAEGGDEKAQPIIDEQTKEYYRQNLKTEKTFEFLEGLFKK
jgi:FKBP-type peptidyl-prolyl cis-trans isomerase (trigger factor)